MPPQRSGSSEVLLFETHKTFLTEQELLLITEKQIAIKRLEQMRDINPMYFQEVMQYESVMKYSISSLENYSYPQIHNILNKGVQQGVFLKDINLAIVTRVIMENIFVLLNTRVFPPEKYSVREVYRSIYLYYFRGLCTTEAISNAERLFAKTLSA